MSHSPCGVKSVSDGKEGGEESSLEGRRGANLGGTLYSMLLAKPPEGFQARKKHD